jgi:hypothetical protein
VKFLPRYHLLYAEFPIFFKKNYYLWKIYVFLLLDYKYYWYIIIYMEGVMMRKKAAEGGFMKDLLERLNGDSDSSSFHTSAFTHAFEGIKARFRELK